MLLPSFINLFVFCSCKYDTVKEMFASDSCPDLTVRGFNISNPNTNPEAGKKCTWAVFKRILSSTKQLTMFINLCCFKCSPASFFSLTACTYLRLFWANTSCLSQPSLLWTLWVKCYPPSHHSCVTGEGSQAQWLKSLEKRTEFAPLIHELVGKNNLTEAFVPLFPRNSLNFKRSLAALYCLVCNPFLWFSLSSSIILFMFAC